MRRLIINADDFGLTRGVNRAIVEAHAGGVLTSATLMAGAAAFAEAAELAREHRELGVGCHVVLVDGEPVSDPARLPSLAPAGRFRNGIAELAAAAVVGRIHEDEVEAEVIVQVRKLQTAGVPVSHFDTHKHAHVFPALLSPLLRAARACGIPAVRNPFEPTWPLPRRILRERRELWKRYAQTRALRRFQPAFRRLVAKAGLKTTDGTVGIVVTGTLDPALLELTLENMPEGTWELVCHPGYDDAELGRVRTRLRQSREVEKAVLTAPETREQLERRGIQLISYRDL